MLYCLGVPEETFLNLQRRAKEFVSVSFIHKKLVQKAKKLQHTAGKDSTYKEIS